MSGTLRLNDTTFATETNGNITTNVSELKINDQTVIDSNKSLNVSDVKVGGNTVIDSNRKMTGVDIVPTTNFTFRNKIINGNLKSARVINQRGASSITGATGYTYDRWYYDGSNYLYQGIEDLNVNNGTYCVSWVGSDITAEYLLSTDSTKNNGWDGAGTFQTIANGGTFTVNESPEHGKHLWIRFSGTLSNLDKVMVEEGTVPTPFEHQPTSVELSLCQRYFQISPAYTYLPGVNGNATLVETNFFLPTPMRATPTLSTSTGSYDTSIFHPGVRTIGGGTPFNISYATNSNIVRFIQGGFSGMTTVGSILHFSKSKRHTYFCRVVMYKEIKFKNELAGIERVSDHASIPLDPANTDYQEYLAWLAEGNEPLPADEPEQSEEN